MGATPVPTGCWAQLGEDALPAMPSTTSCSRSLDRERDPKGRAILVEPRGGCTASKGMMEPLSMGRTTKKPEGEEG